MKRHISTTTLLLTSAVLLFPPSSSFVTALKWQLDNFQCDNDNDPFFTDLNVTVTCNDTFICTFGDTAVITGTLTAVDAFSDSQITIKPCAVGYYCPEAYTQEAGTLCDWLIPANDDADDDDDEDNGQSCGDIGEYEIHEEIQIPKENDLPSGTSSSVLSNFVTVKIEIGQDEECEGSVGTLVTTYQKESITLTRSKENGENGGGGVSPSSTMFLFLTLFAIVAFTAMYAKMHRRQERADEMAGDERTNATRYAKC